MGGQSIQTREEGETVYAVSVKCPLTGVLDRIRDNDLVHVFFFERLIRFGMDCKKTTLGSDARGNVFGDEFTNPVVSQRIGIFFHLNIRPVLIYVDHAIIFTRFFDSKITGHQGIIRPIQ